MKGQVSTELMVIIAVVLIIFIPLLVMVYLKTNDANAQIESYQAELAVTRLAYMANSIGALGSNTSITTEVYIPAHVSAFGTRTVQHGGEIVLKVQKATGETEIAELVKYPIMNPTGFATGSGWARFNITSVYDNNEAKLRIDRTD